MPWSEITHLGHRVRRCGTNQWDQRASRAKDFDILTPYCPGILPSWGLGAMGFGYFGAMVAALGAMVADVSVCEDFSSILGSEISIFWWSWQPQNVAKV